MTYAVTEPELRDRLHVRAAQGEAWRCLRCGVYALGPAAGSGPADEAPVPRRGRALRDAFVMRLLAIERWLRGLFLIAVAIGVYKFDGARDSLQRTFDQDLPALQQLADALHFNLADAAPMRYVSSAFGAAHSTLLLIVAGLTAYGLLQLAEGIGLWIMKRWGEYVAVVGTSLFIPLEIYELVDKFSVFKLAILLLNVAAVTWLILTKRLFGARGGKAAHEAERHSASVIEVERAALASTTAV
jgi:uncharacterized membrane protein (DUF2068 family)